MNARPVWQWILLAGLAAWIAISALQLLIVFPLGHDEAQYALATKDWLHGIEPRWFYLSPGMDVVALPGVLLGDGERALRLLPFVIGIAFVLVVFGLGRRVTTPMTAAWTVALLAGSRPLLQRATELLSDVPSTALMLGAMWLAVTELEREDGPRWRLAAVGPLLSAAFYARYGSVVPIALIVVFALVLWPRAILRRPLPVLGAAVSFGVLFIPHARYALRLTNRVFGILLESKGVPGGKMGDGLVEYLTANPFKMYGMLVPFLMIVGLAAVVVVRRRAVVYVWLVAAFDIVGMGLTTIAQPRYIFLGTTLLALLGVEVVRRLVEARAPNVRSRLAFSAAAAIAMSWIVVTRQAIRYPRTTAARYAPMFAALDAIHADAAGKPCQVINRHATQIEWYFGCLGAWDPPLDAIGRGDAVYALRDDTGGDQPDLTAMPGKHRTIVDTGAVRAIKLERSE